jgi:ADP-ribosylglycohydrolase
MDTVGGGPFRLKPGEWTDDTSMALCLAESLIANRGVVDPLDLAQRFVGWWRHGENSVNGRCFDIGNATSSALASFLQKGQPVGSDSRTRPAMAASCAGRPWRSSPIGIRQEPRLWPARSPR